MNEGHLNSPSCSAHMPGWELQAPERHTHAVSAVNGLRRQRAQRAWGQVGGTCAPEPGPPADSDWLRLLPWDELSIAGVDTAGPQQKSEFEASPMADAGHQPQTVTAAVCPLPGQSLKGNRTEHTPAFASCPVTPLRSARPDLGRS